jgi:hypothetical protein
MITSPAGLTFVEIAHITRAVKPTLTGIYPGHLNVGHALSLGAEEIMYRQRDREMRKHASEPTSSRHGCRTQYICEP